MSSYVVTTRAFKLPVSSLSKCYSIPYPLCIILFPGHSLQYRLAWLSSYLDSGGYPSPMWHGSEGTEVAYFSFGSTTDAVIDEVYL
jgi:hypothetical protein